MIKQSVTLRAQILLFWNDERLMDSPLLEDQLFMMVHYPYTDCFWEPAYDASDLKSMTLFKEDLTKPKLWVVASGHVVSHKSYSFVISCSMDLSLYPSDVQVCNLTFTSSKMAGFKLSFTDRYFSLTERATFDLTYDLILIKRTDVPIIVSETNYESAILTLTFVFQRRLPLYLMTTYLPSFLVTIVSFVSFWIHPEAVPGRVTLGVTCVLALMTQMVSVRSHIMNVNYVTAIDVWFLVCITFVALSMFEFALSYTLNANKKISYLRVNARNPSKLMKLKWRLQKVSTDQWSRILFPVIFLTYSLVYGLTLGYYTKQRREELTK